jgi:hypothetical protein
MFALVVRHNGWLFYQGGDQTFFYTASSVLAGGHIPESEIGYGWSYVTLPIAFLSGPNLIAALPALVLLQTVVLLPVALYCVYGIAALVGGRLVGYVAATAWVALPFLAIPLWDDRYHVKYVEAFLPQAFGLTALGDFPSMVCVLVAALFCVRALDSAEPLDGVLAGIAAGMAIGIKPANALFLAGPLLAFAAARQFRPGLGFGAALAPSLLALALWKYRGLGHLPLITPAPQALAVGAEPVVADLVVRRYLELDWGRLRENYVQLRDLFWGVPLWQSLPILGFLAGMVRSRPKGLLLGGWLAAFIIVKGSSEQANIEGGTLLRLLLPGFPPLVILVALAVLLVPRVGRASRRPLGPAPVRRGLVALVLAVFALVPLLLFATLPPLRDRSVVKYFEENVAVPVDDGFEVEVRPGGGGELISWRAPRSAGVRSFYRVFRSRPEVAAPDPTRPPRRDGIRCVERPTGYAGAADCRLEMSFIGTSRSTSFVDGPPAGPWVYRIGLAANWRDDENAGDVLLLSGPGRLRARH